MLKTIRRHKFITVAVVVIIAIGSYYTYRHFTGNKNTVRYVLAAVEKGTLIASISGSGQVSAFNQIDIKPKVSGDVTAVYVKNNQQVKTGTLLLQLDATDALKTISDAKTALETAQLSLDKLKSPADQLSILQAENSLANANESKQNAEDDLKKAYDDGFTTIANAFLDLPPIMSGLHDILFSSELSPNQWNIDYYADRVKDYDNKVLQYRDDTYSAYHAARTAYDKNFDDYKSASRFSDTGTIEQLLDETYATTKNIAEATRNAINLIQFYQDKLKERNLKPNYLSDTHISTLSGFSSKINADLAGVFSAKDKIQSGKQAILNAERSIAEKTESLAKLKAGPDSLDIRSQELTIQQRQNDLADAQAKLADCSIYAPFDGILASVDVKKGDPVSANTAVATLITKQQIAEISLTEVDVAKVKTGQKATLSFDALPDLSITGQVSDIDAVGTISQGVVSYNVKITFDAQNDQVKPGMSVSVNIITEAKPDVLMVSNSAVKSQGSNYFVQIPTSQDLKTQATANLSNAVLLHHPQNQTVQVGTSNDEYTEIVSGLSQGDIVITNSISSNQSNSSSQTQSPGSNFRIPGFSGGGGFR